MEKIKNLLSIQSSYSTQVDLKRDFNDRVLKEERMSNYKPIKAHRKAFEIIAEGPYTKNSKRFFVLSGSYGTGKSHLLLMAANYFESPSDTNEMKAFFKNYSESEENETEKKADILKKYRKENRYLVCVCDYGANNFETYILRSIKDALEREGIAEQEMDSYYLQAINKIKEWKSSEDSYFYGRLETQLENKNMNWTVNKLIQELSEYNKEAVDVFKDIHKKITTSEFEYEKDNYVQIIEQLAKTKIIKEKFAGILILFDEFDYQLKGKRFDLDEFQKFGQMCAASFMNSFPVIFIATTHRSFSSYHSAYNSEDFLTVNDRIKEIPLNTQGIEEIISAVVNPQKKSALWVKEISPRVSTFNQLSNECIALNLFDGLKAPKVRTKIIENIYPMHPMATYSLLKLASDVGSNNRSVFTFFADEKNDYGSFDWFVKDREILTNACELQFYTVDLLFEYFKDKITSDNEELRSTVKEYVRNFETSLRELSKNRSTIGDMELNNELYINILRTMIIYQIIGISNNLRTLKFGLNMNTQTKEKELEYCLKLACSKKIVYLNDTNQCYEFRRNDAVDVSGLIRDYKQREENVFSDIMAEIDAIVKQDEIKKVSKFFKDEYYFEPANYNFTYTEDKRFIRKFCAVKDIENPGYYEKLVQEMEGEKEYKKSYEGIALYVFCETEDEVKKAKALARKNPSDKIIIGIPIHENEIYDAVFSLKAAFAIDRSEFSLQDSAILKEQVQILDLGLSNKLKQYIVSKNLLYFGKQGIELSNGANAEDTAAVKMFEGLFELNRNKLKHEDVNKSHLFKEANNIALREAVEILLDFNKPVSFRKDYGADHGDIKYIQNVLLQHGVIKQVQTIGNQVICELERNPDKFAKVFPALAAMLQKVLSSTMAMKPQEFIAEYMKTYGIGYNAVILFFAVLKRYLKDSLVILPEAHDIGTLKVTSYDTLLDLLYFQKHKNAVMEYMQIQEHDEFFIIELHKTLINSSGVIEIPITMDQLHEELKKWYKGLDEICRVKSIYENNKLDSFIDVFNRIDSLSVRDFILEEIKTIYGFDRQDLILKDKVPKIIGKFKQNKEHIEQGYYIMRDKLFAEIKTIFNASGSNYDEINEAVNLWLDTLSDLQKSFMNELHNENSKPLVIHLGKTKDCEELFIKTLPNSYHLDSVKKWTTNKIDSYVEKIKAGKLHVEQGLYSVKPPEYRLVCKNFHEAKLDDYRMRVVYSGVLKLEIVPDTAHATIFVTSNGRDPKDGNAQREESDHVFEYETREDKSISFCGIDGDGKYSKTITLQLVNDDNKYEAKYIPKQSEIFEAEGHYEPEIRLTLPKDEDSLLQCIKSIVTQTQMQYQLKDRDFENVLRTLLNEFKG